MFLSPILRTIIIACYGVGHDYLLYFFVIKNYLLVIFSVYLIVELLLEERHRHNLEIKKIESKEPQSKLELEIQVYRIKCEIKS